MSSANFTWFNLKYFDLHVLAGCSSAKFRIQSIQVNMLTGQSPIIFRISQKLPPELLYRKGALKNFAKFTGKYLCQSLFLIKLLAWGLARLWHKCFPVNFTKFLRTSFLQNTSERLLHKSNRKTPEMEYWPSNFT